MSDQGDTSDKTRVDYRPQRGGKSQARESDESVALADTRVAGPELTAGLGHEETDTFEDDVGGGLYRESDVSTSGLRKVHGSLADIDGGFVINGRYRIENRLGVGGFAVVFRAFDQQIQREVAVKVMNTANITGDESLRDNFLERFQREAQLAARIRHANVMSIYDFGVVDGYQEPFMVMELLEGHDLENELTKRGGMSPSRTLPLFVDCLTALGVAHGEGIVHKDLKPPNLFLRQPGTRFEALIVVDFGIAYINEAYRNRMTKAGELMGTPGYIAPEYATEQEISPAVDVYQMGLILIEALAGQPVVDHPDPVAAMFQHVRAELKVPAALMRCPLGEILSRALARKPEHRFASGLEFADALAEVAPSSVPELGAGFEKVILSQPNERLPDAGAGAAEPPAQPSGDRSSSTMFMFGVHADDAATREPSHQKMTPAQGAGRHTPASAPTVDDASTTPTRQPRRSRHSEPAPTESGSHVNLDTRFSESAGTEAQYEELARMSAPSTGKWVGLGLLVALLAGGAAFVLTSDLLVEQEAEPIADEQPRVEPAAAEPQPPAAPPADDEAPAQPEAIEVRVVTEPSGAEVFDGEERLGTAPVTLEFDDTDAQPRQLRLVHQGFEEQSISISPDDAPESTQEMKRISRPAPSRGSTKRETKPKPKPAPAPEESTSSDSRRKDKPDTAKSVSSAAPEDDGAQPEEAEPQQILLPDF